MPTSKQLLAEAGITTPEQLAAFLDGLSEQDREEVEKDLELEALSEAEENARRGDCEQLIALMWPGIILDWFQVEIIESVLNPFHAQTYIKGCTRPGKGFAAAVAANLWYYLFPDSKCILAGPSFGHVKKGLFSEISECRKRMAYRKGVGKDGRDPHMRADSFIDPENDKHYLIIASPENGESFSGQHSSHTIFLFDEASIVPTLFYDNAVQQSRHLVALSNPRTLHGWFRAGFAAPDPDKNQVIATPRGRRALFTIGGQDCTNVREERLENPIGPEGGITINGRFFDMGEVIPPEYYEHVKLLVPCQLDYGRFRATMAHPDPHYRSVMGEGKFPTEDAAKQVVLASWLYGDAEKKRIGHVHYHDQCGAQLPIDCFGLDVAASEDGDQSCLSVGSSEGCVRQYLIREYDTTKLVKWVYEVADKCGVDLRQGKNPITVDAVGLGKGVCDMLRADGAWSIEFKGNTVSEEPRLYGNLRAESYGEFGRRLDPNGPDGTPFAIPNDQSLIEELIAPERIYKAGDLDRFFITPKDRQGAKRDGESETIKEKLGRSPDRADSLVMMYHSVRAYGQSAVPKLNRPIVIDLEAMKAGAELPEELIPKGNRFYDEKPDPEYTGPGILALSMGILALSMRNGKLSPRMIPVHQTPVGQVDLPKSLFDSDEL